MTAKEITVTLETISGTAPEELIGTPLMSTWELDGDDLTLTSELLLSLGIPETITLTAQEPEPSDTAPT